MNEGLDITEEAIAALLYQIDFLEHLIVHISQDDVFLKHKALMTGWVINNYMNQTLERDLKAALEAN